MPRPTMQQMLKMAKVIGYRNVAMMILNQLQKSFDKSIVGRHRWKALLTILVLYKRRQDQLTARRRKKKEAERIAKGLPKKPRDPRKSGISDMWGYLLPEVPFAKGESGAGSWEILGMISLCLTRVAIMNTQSNLVGALDSNMMTRDQKEFWSLFRQTGLLALVATFHRNTYKYTEERLSAVWKQKLTAMIHRKYFKDNNFYNISQLSAMTGEFKDIDSRISEDVKTVSKQMSHVLCEGLYASTAGGFFAWKLGKLYGTRYAIAPYIYLWSALAVTQKLAPVKWGKILGSIRESFSEYRDSLSRLMVHQEAIVAMKGSKVEEEKITSSYGVLYQKLHNLNVTSIWHGLVNNIGFSYWLRAFVGVYVLGPHVFYPSVTDLSVLENVAQLRGTIGHEFVLFIQSMIAAGVTAKMLKQLQTVAGSAGRVNEMIAKLDDLTIKRRLSRHVAADEGSFIEFKDVQVRTPTGVVLVEKLNFKLDRGQSLLLTGHNGAGKSSIFRCLGGLWPVSTGAIVKPGGNSSGLNKEVFFLPQKPYNVLGTLPEQLTYPSTIKDGESVSNATIREILGQVDLEYLLDRPGVMTEIVNWEDELSLGEKQRLAIARLIYHKPQYAILDECTSAVSGAMERTLYDICRNMGITYITISHRPVLRAYHERILTIGLGAQGYTIEEIDHSTLDESTVAFSNTASTSIAPQQMKAEKQYNSTKRKISPKDTMSAALRLLSIASRQSSAWKALTVFVAIVFEARLTVQTTVISSSMMGCVFKQDKRSFIALTKNLFFYSTIAAVFQQVGLYFQKELELDVKTTLSNNLRKRLMSSGNFYKLVQFDCEVDDAEQRIAEDVRDLSETSCQIFAEVIKPVLEMGMYATTLGQIVGPKGTIAMFTYFACGAAIVRLSLPNFKRLVADEAKQEGIFKNAHMRVKTHAESIAFFGGEKRELEVVEFEFNKVHAIQLERLTESWNFGLVNQALVREAPMLVQWLLRNMYGQSHVHADDQGVKDSTKNLFIYESVVRSFESLAALLSFAERFGNLSGLIKRVSDLDSALERCDINTKNAGAQLVHSPNTINFDNVNLVTPSGQSLALGITVNVPQKASLMVTGPNGVGKTSLFRVLAGLWPVGSGQISAPCGDDGTPDICQIFLVPQRMYMPRGSLSEQVTYPERPKLSQDVIDKIISLLTVVGVPYLAERYKMDEIMTWEDVLSLGEQQRLGMARLFYHNPMFGVLDECTSAISVDIEKKLYIESVKRGITCVTISQRLALHEFHSKELKLGSDIENGWKVEEIEDVDGR